MHHILPGERALGHAHGIKFSFELLGTQVLQRNILVEISFLCQ